MKETFLRAVLRHYKLQIQSCSMKLLLHGRAKLYYRIGRLLQAWPQSQFKLEQSLASIEKKYGEDLLEARAIGGLPPVIHDAPEMVVTVQDWLHAHVHTYTHSCVRRKLPYGLRTYVHTYVWCVPTHACTKVCTTYYYYYYILRTTTTTSRTTTTTTY